MLVLSGPRALSRGTREKKNAPVPKHVRVLGQERKIPTLLRCHPILAGTTLPTRDMPTHTGFVNEDALRRPYCVLYPARFGLPSKAHSHRQLPCVGLSRPDTLCKSRGFAVVLMLSLWFGRILSLHVSEVKRKFQKIFGASKEVSLLSESCIAGGYNPLVRSYLQNISRCPGGLQHQYVG